MIRTVTIILWLLPVIALLICLAAGLLLNLSLRRYRAEKLQMQQAKMAEAVPASNNDKTMGVGQ